MSAKQPNQHYRHRYHRDNRFHFLFTALLFTSLLSLLLSYLSFTQSFPDNLDGDKFKCFGFSQSSSREGSQTLSWLSQVTSVISTENKMERYSFIAPKKKWDLSRHATRYFDVGVPISGLDDKIINFAKEFGNAVRGLLEHSVNNDNIIDFRLLVTRYPSDDSSESFLKTVAQNASLRSDQVVFLPVTDDSEFHRAHAINVLHNQTRQSVDSVLAVVDIDMLVRPLFLYNVLTKVTENTIYFPIVFSEYRPSSVRLVEKFLGHIDDDFDKNRGLWRASGFGMYAISGADTSRLTMNETFKGWGGEDADFNRRAKSQGMTIRRSTERGLIHRWHPKYCDLGSYVKNDFVEKCWHARGSLEGSTFARYLIDLNLNEPRIFDTLLNATRSGDSDLLDLAEMLRQEYGTRKDPFDPVYRARSTVNKYHAKLLTRLIDK